MSKSRKVKPLKRSIEALLIPLSSKNLIILRGSRGYVMCGYLNLKVAQKFGDVAIKITGVSSIKDALKAKVHSCTSAARKLGIRKGQHIKQVLKIIV